MNWNLTVISRVDDDFRIKFVVVVVAVGAWLLFLDEKVSVIGLVKSVVAPVTVLDEDGISVVGDWIEGYRIRRRAGNTLTGLREVAVIGAVYVAVDHLDAYAAKALLVERDVGNLADLLAVLKNYPTLEDSFDFTCFDLGGR